MNKQLIVFGCAISVVVLVLAGLSPVIGVNSVKSSVGISPLFGIRTSRAIQEESSDLRCEYIGKGNNFPIPNRNTRTALIQQVIDRIGSTDEEINKFIKLLPNHLHGYKAVTDEDVQEIKNILYQLKTNLKILEDNFKNNYTFFGDQCTFLCDYSSNGNWNPGCLIRLIANIIFWSVLYLGAIISSLISCGYPTQLCCDY